MKKAPEDSSARLVVALTLAAKRGECEPDPIAVELSFLTVLRCQGQGVGTDGKGDGRFRSRGVRGTCPAKVVRVEYVKDRSCVLVRLLDEEADLIEVRFDLREFLRHMPNGAL